MAWARILLNSFHLHILLFVINEFLYTIPVAEVVVVQVLVDIRRSKLADTPPFFPGPEFLCKNHIKTKNLLI
jgi:hypothetical protein